MRLRDLDDRAERDLKSLDQRFVAAAAPKVARAVNGVGDAVRRTVDTATGIVQDVDLRDLNALDEKYATKGPLALFREVPQLLAVITGIIFIVGTIAAAHDLQSRQRADEQTVQGPDGDEPVTVTPANIALGPTIGRSAASYLALANTSLDKAAVGSPDDQRIALVTLSAYYRPEQAASIVSGYVVKRAWVRVSSAGKLAAPLPLEVSGDVGKALTEFYARTARVQRVSARQYQTYVDTITNDPAAKADFAQFAALSRKQAAAFEGDCACVYTFVVTATPTQLLSLRSRPGVRAIEVAGRGADLTGLNLTTLLPETKGVVPNPAQPAPPPS